MRVRVLPIILLTGVAILGASPAIAKSVSSPDGGAKVWTATKTLYVQDTKSDGDSVHGNASVGGNTITVTNNSGYPATVSKPLGGVITAIQACTDYYWTPDNCSSWV